VLVASAFTSSKWSNRGATLGGGPLEDAERPIFDLRDSGLTGDTWPFRCSGFAFTSELSRKGLDLDSEETDGERLLLMRAELREGELEALADSSFLSLVIGAESRS
jgi:hypothetical protein